MNKYFEAVMERNLKDLSTRIDSIQEEINGMQEYLNKLKMHLVIAMQSEGMTANKKEIKNEIDKHRTH